MFLDCYVCGIRFETYKSRVAVCPPCRKKLKKRAINRYAIQAAREQRKQVRSEKRCEWCNKVIVNKQNRYCCAECRQEAQQYQSQLERLQKQENGLLAEVISKTGELRKTYGGRTINTWLTSGFSSKLKEAIKQRDGYKCVICHAETNLHVHHIIPRIQGGPHIPENLITLCGSCHGKVEKADEISVIEYCVRRAINNVNI